MKDIGVISAYSGQVNLLRGLLKNLAKNGGPGDEELSNIEVNTVDGFQGREKDIIIFSCVRSERAEGEKESNTIGFLADKRRMNVSLSRARLCLVVVGNAKKLYTSEKWRKLIDYSYGLDALFDVEKLLGSLSTFMF